METTQFFRKVFGAQLMIILIISFSTCKKSEKSLEIPTVTTITPVSITEISAIVGGFISSDGGSTVIQRGVCYSLNPTPTISDLTVIEGGGVGNFQCTITALNPGSKYFVRAFAKNSAETGYGNLVNFTTIGILPTVVTTSVANPTQHTATCGGNVNNQGSSAVTARGVCWSTSQNPTTSDAKTTDGAGTGNFTSNITGLTVNTTYYVRAYATNGSGIGYGNQEIFSTGTPPTVITSSITNITDISAMGGGNVTSQGSSSVTTRGVCWNTTGNPTLTNCISKTQDGSGTGEYTSNLAGLNGSTTYYVSAYVTTDEDTAYGTIVKQFTTLEQYVCGIAVLYGGKNYQTVLIGTQCWFKENLNIGTRIDGTQQQSDNGIIEKYCYNDIESNCNTYGGLYNWNEMMQYVTTEGLRGICPSAWHLPTAAEWTTLTTSLGGESIAGGKMKETGTSHWYSPNTGATNSSGFTVLPGGFSAVNMFLGLTYEADFFSSSQIDADYTWEWMLNYDSEGLIMITLSKTNRFSVRCIRN